MDARKQKSNSLTLQVLLSHEAQPLDAEEASADNINSHGMRVQTERPWEPGAIVLVESYEEQLWARARVVYCKRLQHNIRYWVGVSQSHTTRDLAVMP